MYTDATSKTDENVRTNNHGQAGTYIGVVSGGMNITIGPLHRC